jgi:hypothetical protein
MYFSSYCCRRYFFGGRNCWKECTGNAPNVIMPEGRQYFLLFHLLCICRDCLLRSICCERRRPEAMERERRARNRASFLSPAARRSAVSPARYWAIFFFFVYRSMLPDFPVWVASSCRCDSAARVRRPMSRLLRGIMCYVPVNRLRKSALPKSAWNAQLSNPTWMSCTHDS